MLMLLERFNTKYLTLLQTRQMSIISRYYKQSRSFDSPGQGIVFLGIRASILIITDYRTQSNE